MSSSNVTSDICHYPTSEKTKNQLVSNYQWCHFDALCRWNKTSISLVHHPDVALMLLFGYGAMWCLELFLLLTEVSWWTGCSWVSPGSRWAPSLCFYADLKVVCFSGWELPFARRNTNPCTSPPHGGECKHKADMLVCAVYMFVHLQTDL